MYEDGKLTYEER